MRYLLDTTLIVDHAHGFEPAVHLLWRLYDEGAELYTCDVVMSQALSGGSDEHIEVVSRTPSRRLITSRPIRLRHVEREGAPRATQSPAASSAWATP